MEKAQMKRRNVAIRWLGEAFAPWTVARFCTHNIVNTSQEDVERYQMHHDRLLDDIEKNYQQNELPKVRQSLKEMKDEIPEYERYEMRRRYLLGQLQELKGEPENPKLKQVMLEIKIFTGKIQGISPDMIVKAREYPITELIKSNRGIAKCPFHPDKTPSMDIRKNFYHCYGCGETGDVIDFIMKRDGLTFKQAIIRLQ